MSWTLIQSASNASSGFAASVTATFGSSVTPGNLIVVRTAKGFTGAAGTDGVADSHSNVYTPGPEGIGGSTNEVACQVWYFTPAVGGASFAVTFTPVASSAIAIEIGEYSASGAYVADGSTSGSGSGTSLSAGSFTTTGSSDLVVAIGAARGTGLTWTAGSGFTLGANAAGSGATIAFACEDALNVSPGTITPTMSNSSGTTWACAAMAFTIGTGSTGSYTITGHTAGLLDAHKLATAAGSYGITGRTSTLTVNVPIAGAEGVYSITGIAGAFVHDREPIGVEGVYTITGKTATLTPSDVLVTAAGLYAITGHTAGLPEGHKLAGAAGSYGITGFSGSFFQPFTVVASAGNYAVTGAAGSLRWGHDLVGSEGAYSITGAPGNLFASNNILGGATGVYSVSRISAGLFDDHVFAGAVGTYAITGVPAFLFQPFTLPATPGLYAITGVPAALGRQITQTATPGVYTITGLPAGLIVANADGTPGPVAYHVYANSGAGDPIDYDAPIDTTSGLSYTTAPLAFPGTWSFGVRAFYVDSMLEERNLDCYVTIILDAAGHDITSRPAPPSSLRAFPLAQGAIRAEWYYPPTTGLKAPTGFHVYTAIGVLSYATPTATVLYSTGIQNSFVANMPGFMDQTTYTVGVRAFNATAEETNMATVTVTAIGVGPSAVESLVGVATAQAG